MDIQQLRNFALVAKMGSITHAAEILHVSQPNLSMNIKRLENELGLPLFDRVKTRIILTPIGKLFLDHVDQALRILDNGVEQAQTLYSAPPKVICIASCDSSWLIPLSSKYLRKFPNQNIRTLVADAKTIMPALLKGEIDFAVGPEADHPDSVEWIPVYTEDIGILVSTKHPLAKSESVPLEALKNERFILNIHLYPKEYVCSLFRPAGFTPNIICECNDNPITGPMIEANMGISLVDLNATEAFRQRNSSAKVVLVPFETEITRQIGVFHLKNTDLPIETIDIKNAYFSYFTDFSDLAPSNQEQA